MADTTTPANPLFPPEHLARRVGQMQPHPIFANLAERLTDRLRDTKQTFTSVLNLSRDAGATAAALAKLLPKAEITNAPEPLESYTPSEPESYDLIVIGLTLATVNEVPQFLHRLKKTLKPDGLLLASTLGLESFTELRTAWQHANPEHHPVTPLTDVRTAAALLQRLHFALPVADRDLITLTFPSFEKFDQTARQLASRTFHPQAGKGLTTPRQRQAMQKTYSRLHPREDGRIPLTIEVLYLHGWQPAPTQQQPAKRGSGKFSLVKILGGQSS